MTAAEIEAMPAGRELDALVAEKVLGYRRWGYRWMPGSNPERWLKVLYPPDWTPPEDYSADFRVADGTEKPINDETLPRVSTELPAALVVVDKLLEHWDVYLEFTKSPGPTCLIGTRGKQARYLADECAPTMPLAICRAALLAVWATEQDEGDGRHPPECVVA